MVSSGTEEHNATTAQPQVQAQPPQAVAGASATEEQIPTTLTSKTIEMSDLPTTTGASLSTPEATTTTQPQTVPAAVVAPPTEQTTTTTNNPPHPDLNRSQTAELALGPDGEPAPNTDPSTPTLRITLMLTTGARHAYTISQKYLSSRKVSALDASGNFDPREMSGYKLKELIWTDWRAEWEARLPDRALMLRTNPAVIPRNHRVEAMIEAAVAGDPGPLERLRESLARPFDAAANDPLREPPSEEERVHQTFCGT